MKPRHASTLKHIWGFLLQVIHVGRVFDSYVSVLNGVSRDRFRLLPWSPSRYVSSDVWTWYIMWKHQVVASRTTRLLWWLYVYDLIILKLLYLYQKCIRLKYVFEFLHMKNWKAYKKYIYSLKVKNVIILHLPTLITLKIQIFFQRR